MKNSDKITELIADTLKRIDKLDELVVETRELAKAANQQAIDSRYLLEMHVQWHQKPIWKKWFGLK
ncbi:MAG: hypothetical protein AAGG59_04590 [Bacteroidota bacterium]